jgi:hypothetical protein
LGSEPYHSPIFFKEGFMELFASERLALLSVLPKEGDFTTLKIVRQLREDLSFSEEEHKALDIQIEAMGDGRSNVRFKPENDVAKDIPIGEKATDLIVATLKKLDSDKKLSDIHFSVYERFVESK